MLPPPPPGRQSRADRSGRLGSRFTLYDPRVRFQLLTRARLPDFLDLPWERPLTKWDSPRLVEVTRGIGRHVVRFVEYEGRVYALKELPERLAEREFRLLRQLEERSIPVVELVGLVAAEIFHELLDHRWYRSEAAGRDIGLTEAVRSYVDQVLTKVPDEGLIV